MEQVHNQLPGAENPEPAETEMFNLAGCPYLGLLEDAQTSLAFPHEANHCHRLDGPVGVDLAHQKAYCLSRQFVDCYVYGQPEAPAKRALPARPGAQTVDWRARLSAVLPEGFDPSAARASAQRLLALLTLKERWPDDLNQTALGAGTRRASWASFRERLPATPGLAALRAKVPAAWNRERLERELRNNRRMLGLAAVPLFLLLIVLAALAWWPPPGETEPDALAMGAVVDKETVLSAEEVGGGDARTGEEAQPASPAAVPTVRAGPARESATTGGSENEGGVRAPEGQIQHREAPSEETAPAEAPASPPPVVVSPPIVVPTGGGNDAVAGAEATLEEREAPAVTDSMEEEAAEAQIAEAAASTAARTQLSPLPAAAVASIGPVVAPSGSGEEGDGPLSIYTAPDNEAEVVSQLGEQQAAAVLGRDPSDGWILIRLSAGIEGWVRAEESGAVVDLGRLPTITENAVAAAVEQVATAATEPTSAQPADENLTIAGTAIVNTGALNLRSGPGIEYTPVGYVFNRQPVSLLGQSGGSNNVWVLVRTADGQQGWMNSLYLIQTE